MQSTFFVRIVVVFLAIFFTLPARAQTTPPPIVLGVPHLLQDTYVWCWVSSAQMVLQYRGLNPAVQQCRLLEVGYDLPNGYCCTDGGSRCMRGAQHMFEVQRLVSYAGGVPSKVTLAQDPMSLYSHLMNDRPVIVEIATGPGSSHAIVVIGMRFEDRCGPPQCQPNPYGPPFCRPGICARYAFTAINDPFRLNRYELEYGQLLSVWKSALVVGHQG